MRVTEVKLHMSTKPGIVKAFGKATLDDELSLDVIVMDKEDGRGAWTTFPGGKKGTDGKFYLPVFFKTKELNEAFKNEVLRVYNEMKGSSPAPSQPASSASNNIPF